MQSIPKPINQWALSVYLLAERHKKGLTTGDAIERDKFYKFCNRLSEVEFGRENKLKLIKVRLKFTNRFKHAGSHLNYKSLASFTYLCNLIKKLNREGQKAIHYPKYKNKIIFKIRL